MKPLYAIAILFVSSVAHAQAWNTNIIELTAPTTCTTGQPISACPVTGYRIERAPSSAGAFAAVGTTQTLSFTHTGVAAGANCYRAVALSANGEAGPSNVVCKTNAQPVGPPNPATLRIAADAPAPPATPEPQPPATPAPPPSSAGETVGTWSQRDFAQPFRINMEPGSYPVWVAGGATHTNLAGAWDGSRFARITPPTSVQIYGGIGSFPLPAGVNTLSLRWEMRAGPTFASGGQAFEDNKHVIIHTSGGNRAMMNIQPAGGGCLQMAIAQGTVKQFNQTAQGGSPRGMFAGENNDVFRWCDTASSSKAIPAGEWLSIEIQVSCATMLHASGHIRAIVHRRTSSQPLVDYWIPWDYDAPARCTNFTNIEGIGDYFNGRGNGAAGTHFDIAGVTIATNRGAPLGPRAGFVQ